MAQDEVTAAAAEEPVADSAPSDPPMEDDAGAAAEGAKQAKKRKAKAPRETKAKKKPAAPRKPPAHPPYADVRLRWNPFLISAGDSRLNWVSISGLWVVFGLESR